MAKGRTILYTLLQLATENYYVWRVPLVPQAPGNRKHLRRFVSWNGKPRNRLMQPEHPIPFLKRGFFSEIKKRRIARRFHHRNHDDFFSELLFDSDILPRKKPSI